MLSVKVGLQLDLPAALGKETCLAVFEREILQLQIWWLWWPWC